MNREAATILARRHPLLSDALLGLLAMAVTVTVAGSLYSPRSEVHRLGPMGLAIALFCVVVVTFRRRWPLPVLVVLALATLVSLSVSLPAGFTEGAMLVVAGTGALRNRSTVSLAACATVSGVFLLRSVIAQGFGGLEAENLNLVILTVPS